MCILPFYRIKYCVSSLLGQFQFIYELNESEMVLEKKLAETPDREKLQFIDHNDIRYEKIYVTRYQMKALAILHRLIPVMRGLEKIYFFRLLPYTKSNSLWFNSCRSWSIG